jgi:Fe-S cluster assembly protein SufD
MTRGLPRLEAQRLIVEGFFAPVLDRIPLETVRERLRDVIRHKIG